MTASEMISRYNIHREGDKIRVYNIDQAKKDGLDRETLLAEKPAIMEEFTRRDAEEEAKRQEIIAQTGTIKVLYHTQHYGTTLEVARFLTEEEKSHYTEEYREHMLAGTRNNVELENISWEDIDFDHFREKGWYTFPGCSGEAWPVTDEEWDYFVALNAKKTQQKEDKQKQDRIAHLKEMIAKAERQADIPTKAEAKERRIAWNNLHNEGGEGFVPTWIDIDWYNAMKQELAEAERY